MTISLTIYLISLADDLYRTGNVPVSGSSSSSPNHYINPFSYSSSSPSISNAEEPNTSFYRSIDSGRVVNHNHNHLSANLPSVDQLHHQESNEPVAYQQNFDQNRYERGFRLFKQAYHRSSSEDAHHHGQQRESAVCPTPDGRNGMCYDAAECADRGGVPMGRCSSAASSSSSSSGSVCCLFESTCGDAVGEKHSYFRSPGYPTPFDQPLLCRLKVNKPLKGDICQLRLQFTEFDIAKPVEGNCTQDIFSVSGQNENNIIPRICGFNTGQHCE